MSPLLQSPWILEFWGSFGVFGMAELTGVPDLPCFEWLLGGPQSALVGIGFIGWPLVESTGPQGLQGPLVCCSSTTSNSKFDSDIG